MTTSEKAKKIILENENSEINFDKPAPAPVLSPALEPTFTVSNPPAVIKKGTPRTMMGMKSNDVKSLIELYKPLISQVLPKHLTAERIINVATTLIARTPELAECSVESLIGAVVQCSILGFEPIPILGQAYLIPFNNSKTQRREVQFIIGYKGLIDLARRSDKIQTLYAQAVYSKDFFDYEFGLEPKLVHKPALGERGEFTHAYAIAKFTNGGFAFEVMSKKDIEKIKKMSKASNSNFSPWSGDEIVVDEMRKKTVVRRLSKYLPMSIEIYKTLATDEKILTPDNFKEGEVDLATVEPDAVE